MTFLFDNQNIIPEKVFFIFVNLLFCYVIVSRAYFNEKRFAFKPVGLLVLRGMHVWNLWPCCALSPQRKPIAL